MPFSDDDAMDRPRRRAAILRRLAPDGPLEDDGPTGRIVDFAPRDPGERFPGASPGIVQPGTGPTAQDVTTLGPMPGFELSRLRDARDLSPKYVFGRWAQGRDPTTAMLDQFVAEHPEWERQGADQLRMKQDALDKLRPGTPSVWQDVIRDVGGPGAQWQFENADGGAGGGPGGGAALGPETADRGITALLAALRGENKDVGAWGGPEAGTSLQARLRAQIQALLNG